MPALTLPSTPLSPADFGRYSANWVTNFLPKPSLDAFKNPDTQPDPNHLLTWVSFELTTIGSLLSTVGADHINARFLLDDKGKFTLTLYAVDARGNAMSGYYMPDALWSISWVKSSKKARHGLRAVVPAEMAKGWLKNWTEATSLTSANFNPGSGPLIGYNFKLNDFLKALLGATDYSTQMLGVGLCLREYYATDSHLVSGVKKTVQIFGLVLRVCEKPKLPKMPAEATNGSTAPEATTNGTAKGLLFFDLEDPFYDLSMPSPPN